MMAYGFTPQYEKFTGIDPLEIWIREAHKRGIKVHTWFETFYAGNQSPNDNPNSILAKILLGEIKPKKITHQLCRLNRHQNITVIS